MRSLLRALILSCAAIPFAGSHADAAFTVTSPDPTPALGYLSDLFDQSSLVPGPLPVPSGGFSENRSQHDRSGPRCKREGLICALP